MNNLNKNYRVIFHVDMNCFFASCEVANDPSLKNKPVIIAKKDIRKTAIILTASYEARKYGIYTTMLVKDALKLCPHAEVIEPNMELYQYYSKCFFDYLNSITNKLEKMSIDEGYLDVSDCLTNNSALELAEKIQTTLLKQFSLPCSIGIGPNKFLAKMGSNMKKPLGITVLRKREIASTIWPLDISNMFGVGKKTAPKLRSIGINKIGDLVNCDQSKLQEIVGLSMTSYLMDKVYGNDDEPVNYQNVHDPLSISTSSTFEFPENSTKSIKSLLKVLTNSVSHQLEKQKKMTRHVGIQIKYDNFNSLSRGLSMTKPIVSANEIWFHIEKLFDEYYLENSYLRLVGVFATNLTNGTETIRQYSLFDDISKMEKTNEIHTIMNEINNRFQNNLINIGFKKKKE